MPLSRWTRQRRFRDAGAAQSLFSGAGGAVGLYSWYFYGTIQFVLTSGNGGAFFENLPEGRGGRDMQQCGPRAYKISLISAPRCSVGSHRLPSISKQLPVVDTRWQPSFLLNAHSYDDQCN